MSSSVQCADDRLAQICGEFANYDINGDGAMEIEHLRSIVETYEGNQTGAAGERPLILILVEDRLLQKLPGDAGNALDLAPSLERYAKDLAEDGWRARLISAKVYAGERHQDGRTVLALRRFFQKVNAELKPFAGVVMVGNFPEAFLVRSYNWRKKTPITLNAGKPNEKKFEEAVDYLRTVPEPVAMRCELVLCDLDGNWEQRYVEKRERLPTVYGIFPGSVPERGGICADFERDGVVFEDFFYINDGICDVREVVVKSPDGKSEEVVGIDFVPLDEFENAECSAADRARPNPMSRPDIVVSRINARNVALQPKPEIKGTGGEGLIGADGRPQMVRFADEKAVPRWISVWRRDDALERRLLIEYFRRNNRYRKGEFAASFRPAAIGCGLGDGFDNMRGPILVWKDFDGKGYRGGAKATLLDYAEWLKLPAVMRDVRAHSDPWGSTFDKPDIEKLNAATGGCPWTWSQVGDSLVPSLESACEKGKADFALYRTMWANGLMPDCACFYMHQGCDGISPARAEDRPYNHEDYGYWQGAEAMLFYANGLALVGRAKVFYDEPRGFYDQLAAGRTFGEAWAYYYEVESAAKNAEEVGGGIGRKRAYFWSALGDWTLRLKKQGG